MYRPGDVIGPYTLVRKLGHGAFGEVWLADRASSLITTQVALKIPHDSQADLDAIRAEAQVWLKASGHPNVVPVLAAEVYEDQVVIASEYVAGGSLAEWLTEQGGKAPSPEAAVGMARAILAGLEHLHVNHLVHRDLKPENVLLQSAVPRLTDFGLTRVLQPSGNRTELAGTPAYMAPEVFEGRFSPASDLWAAAVILHQLLVGELPFPQTDFYSLLIAITGPDPAPISDHIPDALAPVLRRALTKTPDDRFASAAEMASALDAALTRGDGLSDAPVSRKQAPNNLPLQVTSFVGRETELADVKRLLGSARLVTLTASGGTGKTRLSLQAAQDVVNDYPDGVWLVELAALSEPGLVLQTIARVLDVSEARGEPIAQTLVRSLKSRRLLVILDNCEHLIASCSEAASLLLRSCAGVSILASSREAFNIAGESVYVVPPLSLPDPKGHHTVENLSQYDAVRLFLDRALAVRPDFAVTNQNAAALAQVCYRLDGIPLALELAAARVRAMPLEEINARLDNRFRLLTGGSRTALPRQQTLKALIDWSYDLLNDQERTLFARLSVFSGGWTLEAAEQVCSDSGLSADHADRTQINPGEVYPKITQISQMQRNTPLTSSPSHPLTLSPPHPIEDWEVFDLLTALVDKSLVVGEVDGPEVRYRMLESLREYAAEKLRAGGASEETADRHARYYAGAVAEKLGGASGASAAEREREYPWMLEEADNVRAALDRLWRIGETVRAATVTVSLRQFWTRNGWLREARANMDTAIARIEDLEDPALRARVLKDGGWFAFLLGDLTTAEDLNTRSIETAIAAGAADIHANALNTLALIAQSLHDPHRAEALFTEAIDMARTLGQPTVLADYLTNLGYLQSKLGRQEQAQALFAEARALNEAHGNESGMAAWLCNQSDAALRQNNWKEAQEYAEQSLERFRKIDNPLGIAYALANLADAASRQYLHALAEASIAEAVGICREIGHFDLLPNLFLTRARTRYTVGDARGAALLLTGTARLHALLQSAPEPSAHAESENLERGIRGMGAGDALDAACRQIAPLDLDQLTSQLLAEAWASMA